MSLISIANFKGKKPRESPKLLPNSYAQTAENVFLDRGKIQAVKEVVLQGTVQKATPAAIFKCGTKWDSWASFVDVVRSWIYDANPRFYVTDGSQPKQTKLNLINDCLSSADASTYYDLGISAPTSAPTLAFTYDGGTPGDDIQATIGYVFTYVTDWGEESAPSPASAVGEIYDDGYCTVTCPTPAGERDADTNITDIRVYRLAVGTAGAEYQYLTEVSIGGATTAATDRDGSDYAITPDADLGSAIETEDYDPPPAALIGLISFGVGMMAGFVNNEVYLNEPFIPYAFPEEYKKEFESDVVSIGATGNMFVVSTDTHPYVGFGSDPESLIPKKLPDMQGSVARRGMVSTKYGVIYPSPDGLILISTDGSASLITDTLYTKDQWNDLTPSSFISFFYDDKYFAFYLNADTGLVFDLINTEEPCVLDIELSQYPTGYDLQIKDGYVDPASDILYLLVYSSDTNYYVLQFDQHASNLLTYDYKSKEFYERALTNYGCGRIESDFSGGAITLKLYADGTLKSTKTVSSTAIFRLPSGYMANTHEIEVTGTSEIEIIELASTPDELM